MFSFETMFISWANYVDGRTGADDNYVDVPQTVSFDNMSWWRPEHANILQTSKWGDCSSQNCKQLLQLSCIVHTHSKVYHKIFRKKYNPPHLSLGDWLFLHCIFSLKSTAFHIYIPSRFACKLPKQHIVHCNDLLNWVLTATGGRT